MTQGGSGSLLSPTCDGRPMKSILKKTNSFSLHNFGQSPSRFSPYMTVRTSKEFNTYCLELPVTKKINK